MCVFLKCFIRNIICIRSIFFRMGGLGSYHTAIFFFLNLSAATIYFQIRVYPNSYEYEYECVNIRVIYLIYYICILLRTNVRIYNTTLRLLKLYVPFSLLALLFVISSHIYSPSTTSPLPSSPSFPRFVYI